LSSGLQAAQAKLAAAREAQDINAEVDAQREIAKLGYEEARLWKQMLRQHMKMLQNNKFNLTLILTDQMNQKLDQILKQSLGELKTNGLDLIQL
jgi:hypothetical protein